MTRLLLEGASLEQLVPRVDGAIGRGLSSVHYERVDAVDGAGPDVVFCGEPKWVPGGSTRIELAAGDDGVAVTLRLVGRCVPVSEWRRPDDGVPLELAAAGLRAGVARLLVPLGDVQVASNDVVHTCAPGVRRAALRARVTDPQGRGRAELLDLIEEHVVGRVLGDELARVDDRRLEVADGDDVYLVRAVTAGVVVWATSPCRPDG